MNRTRVLAAGIAMSVAVLAPQASALDRGDLLASSCYACHTLDASGNMPNLDAYPRDLMVSQMKAFRDGSRPGTIMNRLARGYSEEEIVLIADHFGKKR